MASVIDSLDFVAEARAQLIESARVKSAMADYAPPILAEMARRIVASVDGGGKVLIFGNGGSAADSQHIAAELVGRYLRERPGIAAIALTTDSSNLTALGNDYGYEHIFTRQIEALGRPGDIAWGITTSGKSPNVNLALALARERGLVTLAFSGKGGGPVVAHADCALVVPSNDTPRIQESHIAAYHIICDLVERVIASRV